MQGRKQMILGTQRHKEDEKAQAAKTQKTIMEDSKFKFMQCAYYHFRPGSYCIGRVASGPMKRFFVYTSARYQWASTCRAVLALHVKWLENSRRQDPKYVPPPRYRDAYGLEGYQGDVLSLAAAAKAPAAPLPKKRRHHHHNHC